MSSFRSMYLEAIEEINKSYIKGYKQGRADKYQEIVSEYMLLTEEQVCQIRADEIEECGKLVLSAWRKCIKEYPLSDRTPFTNMVNEIMDGFESEKQALMQKGVEDERTQDANT